MIINPIIPVWLMVILCIILLIFKRKGTFNYIRQIIIIILLFVINLRIMVPNGDMQTIQKDVDVLFVVDNTISMMAEDYGSDNTERMLAVRSDCNYIMQQLPGAAFSVVSFGNNVKKMLPYTIDTLNVEQALLSLHGQSSLYATGTNFEDILTYLEDFLDRDSDHLQIVFFISDGEITQGDALVSHSVLKDFIDGGAVLGYGTEKGGPMMTYAFAGDDSEPDRLYYYDENYNRKMAISVIDEENLKDIASDMGVSYVHMTRQSNINRIISQIQNQIDNLVETQGEDSTRGYSDTYFYLFIPLIPLLVVDFIYYKRKVNF